MSSALKSFELIFFHAARNALFLDCRLIRYYISDFLRMTILKEFLQNRMMSAK
jgi:hypothetical protein